MPALILKYSFFNFNLIMVIWFFFLSRWFYKLSNYLVYLHQNHYYEIIKYLSNIILLSHILYYKYLNNYNHVSIKIIFQNKGIHGVLC